MHLVTTDPRQPMLDAINEAIMAAEGAPPVSLDDLDAMGVRADTPDDNELDMDDLVDVMLDLSLSRVGHDWQ